MSRYTEFHTPRAGGGREGGRGGGGAFSARRRCLPEDYNMSGFCGPYSYVYVCHTKEKV